jgi:hypothetical protein
MGSSFRIAGAKENVIGKEAETIDLTSICQVAAAPQADVVAYQSLPGQTGHYYLTASFLNIFSRSQLRK